MAKRYSITISLRPPYSESCRSTIEVANGSNGLALFDACPSRATSDGLPGPDGQALDKAPGRKPRNEARPFSRGAALWAFERRLIAQVRDVHGASPGAASCVKTLPALGGVGKVRAAWLVMRMAVAGVAGLDQARPNGCWR